MLRQDGFSPETGDVETYCIFYNRDSDGNVVSTHDSLGDWTSMRYDEEGRGAEKQNSYGLHQLYRYDVAGRCVEEVDVAHRTVARNVYDAGGRLVARTEAEAVVLSGGKAPEAVTFHVGWMFDYDVNGREKGRTRRKNIRVRLVETSGNFWKSGSRLTERTNPWPSTFPKSLRSTNRG